MLPTIIVKRDFDGFFERQVKAAIEMNERSGVPMVSTINLSSGPYRPYDMKFVKASDSCDLDFYSASRVFGGDYTIKDIAECIAKKV